MQICQNFNRYRSNHVKSTYVTNLICRTSTLNHNERACTWFSLCLFHFCFFIFNFFAVIFKNFIFLNVFRKKISLHFNVFKSDSTCFQTNFNQQIRSQSFFTVFIFSTWQEIYCATVFISLSCFNTVTSFQRNFNQTHPSRVKANPIRIQEIAASFFVYSSFILRQRLRNQSDFTISNLKFLFKFCNFKFILLSINHFK